ncbi:exodeoxyribonuclease VII large subunit [Carnimonas nigrificans]|uniref:exodeoxyribonuclease VII large subunit n=1 Tax=Carnimonas nigrificans TaxID=64323 RepID=UPI0004728076|nr:exodeoxyribonuclease VII large subunit [Carnimonas nigrificans]
MSSSFLNRFLDTSEPSPDNDDEALTVTALNKQARQLLEGNFNSVWVQGEISSLSQPRSGHAYFTLKDDDAQVRCALFRQRALGVRAPLREGQLVQVRAQVSLFEARGDYQLIVEAVREAGKGALLAALEALRVKLGEEGIFANGRALPYPPERLAVITSPTGAALQDVISVLTARWPWVKVILVPVQVQGDYAAEQIASAVRRVNTETQADAILLTRGGGSFEDLWCFNDERVARAIHGSHIPVMSAVGHETDTTLADYAADVRAPTPSAAAERLVPDQRELRRQLAQLARRLLAAKDSYLNRQHQRLDYIRARLRHPGEHLRHQRLWLTTLENRLHSAKQRRQLDAERHLQQLSQRLLNVQRSRLNTQLQHLNALEARLRSPLEQLRRYRALLASLEQRLIRAQQRRLHQYQQEIRTAHERLQRQSPQRRLIEYQQQLELLETRLQRIGPRLSQQGNTQMGRLETRLYAAIKHHQQRSAERLGILGKRLDIASPLATLRRGYTVLEKSDHSVVRSAADVQEGERLSARLGEGRLSLEVKSKTLKQ